MSIKLGRVKTVEEIDGYNFFKLRQNKIDYYAINLYLSEYREGYLIFSLPSDIDSLFKKTEYNLSILVEIFKQKVDEFYFISFTDENPETHEIEYVAKMEKSDVLNIYEKG